MKAIRIRITDLLEEHGDTFQKCKGCATCEEIKTLRKKLERDPAEKFKHILAKGQDMTRSDIEFLIENEVQRKKITKALGMGWGQFCEMMKNFGLRKRGDNKVAKLTFEEYQDLKAKGWTNKQIATEKGINADYISQLKKQWGLTAPQTVVKEVKPSEGVSAKEDKTAEYERLMAELQRKLEHANYDRASKARLIDNLQMKIAEYENPSVASEISSLREEKEKLFKDKVHNDYIIENQKYQLGQYAKQNEELQEENTALKVLARRYLA